jgi:hypothetical protein
MANALRDSIQHLAAEFATAVLRAIRAASLDDILEGASGGSASASTGAPVKRGPGRPRKHPLPTGAAAPAASASARRESGKRGGRLGRRTASDIATMTHRIVSLLEEHPEGLRAEEIRKALGVQSKELPRPLSDAVEAGTLGKKGNKRATTYFIGGPTSARGGKKK